MTVIILKWLQSKIMGNLSSVLLIVGMTIIVIFLLSSGLGKLKGLLGFETIDSVKTELAIETNNREQLTSVNKSLTSDIVMTEAVNKVVEAAIVKRFEDIETFKSNTNQEISSKDREIEALKEQLRVSAIQQTETKPIVKAKVKSSVEKKISHVQVSALWSKYCSFNTNNNCSTLT